MIAAPLGGQIVHPRRGPSDRRQSCEAACGGAPQCQRPGPSSPPPSGWEELGIVDLIPGERRLILTKAQASEPRSDSMVAPSLVIAHDCPGRTAFQANSWPDNSRSGSVMREWRALPLASSPTKHGRARKTHQRPPLSQGGACAKRL